jgi:ubiquitin carboxyl-terminal hydrolase 7
MRLTDDEADRQMAQRVGDYLKHDNLKLRFTSSNPTTGQPKAVIKRALNQSVADICSLNYYASQPSVILFYELLDISIVELETKKSLKVIWTGRNNKEELSYPFLLPKTSSFGDLGEHLSKTVKMQPGGSGRIRIFEIASTGRAQKECSGAEMIGNLPELSDLYAEVSLDAASTAVRGMMG